MVTLTRPARTASPSVEHPQLETPPLPPQSQQAQVGLDPTPLPRTRAAGCRWWIGSATGLIREEILAGPPAVWTAFAELYQSGQLVDFGLASLQRAALGVSVGVIVGLVLGGVLSGLSSLGEELIDSTMQINRAVPFLALVPLFIAWFGIDETFKVVLIAVATVAPHVRVHLPGSARSRSQDGGSGTRFRPDGLATGVRSDSSDRPPPVF